MCITELIHVFQILHVYYGTYTCLTELILVSHNLYLCTGLILILQILYLCEGTRRHDKSEHIRIISHTRSDQTSTDTDISLS